MKIQAIAAPLATTIRGGASVRRYLVGIAQKLRWCSRNLVTVRIAEVQLTVYFDDRPAAFVHGAVVFATQAHEV